MENKIGSTGCKWSSLNAKGIETSLSYPKKTYKKIATATPLLLPVVYVDVDPVSVSPEPDPDHPGVVRPAEHLIRGADPVEELLFLRDGRARRQEPAVPQNPLSDNLESRFIREGLIFNNYRDGRKKWFLGSRPLQAVS